MAGQYNEFVRQIFSSEEEGWNLYNKYAKDEGFSVRKSYCEWDKDHNERILRKFVCSREGFRAQKELKRENKKRKPRDITRVGCPAKLVIAREPETQQWYVKDFTYQHNHPMAATDLSCFLRSHRRISDAQKADIVAMQIAGIRKHKIMDVMEIQYGGYDKVGFTLRDLYNFCHSNKVATLIAGDARTVIRHMKERSLRDPDFFFNYKTDGEGHLNGLLWCDCQCRLDYVAFGDVVVFDSTYKTNRYNMPLVPFVGVNQHGSTVLFACAIVSQETIGSYVWLLKTFSDAMRQRHPVSVITDGDLAMQRAIGMVWPNSSHRLCIWHIEQNIVRNVNDDDVKDDLRSFLYDCCSRDDIERKWQEFLDDRDVTDTESWLYQMYERREVWCAAYHVGESYLGLRSNQRSESLNSRIQEHLDRKMTLLELIAHFDHVLSRLRRKEAKLDFEASNCSPCLEADASVLEKDAARLFTPGVFVTVQFSIKAAKKCFTREIEDGYDTLTYHVGRQDKGDREYHVECQIGVDDGSLKGISCSCMKLQSLRIPCSHIFFVLGERNERELPNCCVLKRWTRDAKSSFPPVRKSTMYDYSDSLKRYQELRNLSQTAAFVASRSPEAFERLKRVLHEEAAVTLTNDGDNRDKGYGPVLQLGLEDEPAESETVLDPMHVPGRGAPKKKLKSASSTTRSKTKCTLCKGEGHNRRTCTLRKEETMLPEDVQDI